MAFLKRYCVLLFLLFSCSRIHAQLLDSLTLDTMNAYTSLEEAMRHPEKVIKLELKREKLKQFPLQVLKFTNLQYLDLSKNKIKELPEGIDTLKNLQFLILSRNKLEKLPKQIGGLPNLKLLNINQNELFDLPAQLGKLEKLEVLDLWSNNIGSFPEEMKYMKNLRVLDLRVIMISDEEQAKIKSFLPNTKIFLSPNCKCQL